MTTKSDIVSAAVRNELKAHVIKTFDTLNPGQLFKNNWHVDAICHHLELCRRRKIKRLIITMPPRHLKSICASVAFPTWLIGNDPTAKITCVSYSDMLAVSFSNDRRRVMQSAWHRKTFPKLKMNQKTKNTEHETTTTNGGKILATSIGGTLTGMGGNIFIIDDPMKADDARSDSERNRVNDWYRRTLMQRLDSPKDDVIIIVMQRLHADDLVGNIPNQDDWTLLELPAIAQEDQEIAISDDEVFFRPEGDILHENHCGAEELKNRLESLGSNEFAAQYLQRPVPPGGVVFKRGQFKTFDTNKGRDSYPRVFQSWDTASQVNENNSYSVCLTFGIIESRFYLLDVYRGRLAYPDLKAKVISHARNWGADRVLVEKASSGIALIQDIEGRYPVNVIGITPRGDKDNRAEQVSAIVEAGRVFLPDDASWLADFLKEVLGFPNVKHKDQVDALSQFLWYVDHAAPRPLDVKVWSVGPGGVVDYNTGRGSTYYDRMGGSFPF